MPNDDALEKECMELIEQVCKEENLEFLHWRDTPVYPDACGSMARKVMPRFK